MSETPAAEPRRLRRGLVLALVVVVLVVAVTVSGVVWASTSTQAGAAAATHTSTTATPVPARPTPAVVQTPTAIPIFDRHARSLDDPASIWVVSNKTRPLSPIDFEPTDLVDVPVAHTWDPQLRQEASDALVAMFAAAQSEAGLELASNSAYRGYNAQVSVYNREVASFGQAAAEQSVARPGYSEHQTGLAIDIGAASGRCSVDYCFGDMPEGQWLAANAYRFGFLLRYPADKVAVTGFEFEPWHYRYIGVDLATEMHQTGITTLEEFFGLPAAPGYP